MKGIYDLAVIGAGPAGLGAAAEAYNSGISPKNILILEKAPEHSYSIRKFYPDKKLVTANYKGNVAKCEGVLCIPDLSKQETLSYLDNVIKKYHLNVQYNQNVFSIEKQDGHFLIRTAERDYRARTCAIAIGVLGKPNKPHYPIPADLRDKVTFDITTTPIFNKRVLVVGGGDSASEYAQYLVEQNNKVYMSYRRDQFSRMLDHNLDALYKLQKQEKITVLFSSNVRELHNDNGPLISFEEEKYDDLRVDHVVLALGGTTPKNFLKLQGIEFEDGWPILDKGNQTTVKGLYLVGDLVQGPRGGSIITAFNSAHHVVQSIKENYLRLPKIEQTQWLN